MEYISYSSVTDVRLEQDDWAEHSVLLARSPYHCAGNIATRVQPPSFP
jgi:hypothetical protein